jgi:hypothetical protein
MQSYTSESLRVRNDEHAVELRAKRRIQEQIKRRLKVTPDSSPMDRLHAENPSLAELGICQVSATQFDYLKQLKWIIEHPRIEAELQDAVQVLVLNMSKSKNNPISQVVALGYIPLLVSLSNLACFPLKIAVRSIQSDAVWVLGNIASGEHAHSAEIVAAGGDVVFVNSIISHDMTLSSNGILGTGNIAGDCPAYRDKLLELNAAECIMEALETAAKQHSVSHIIDITWAVKNLVRGRPAVSIQYLESTLPMISKLSRLSERKVVKEALWAVVNILEGDSGRVQTIINHHFLEVLLKNMASEHKSLHLPACRAIGTVASGTNEQTRTLLNLRALDVLSKLLNSEAEIVRKEAYWTLSNLVVSSEDQVREVMSHGIIRLALNGLADTHDIVQEEALWVFSNLCSLSSPYTRLQLIQLGILDYCRGFTDAKPRPLIVRPMQNLLSIFDGILSVSHEIEEYHQTQPLCSMFYEAELIPDIETMCQHGNQAVSDMSCNLLKQYFDLEPSQLVSEETPPTFVFS